MFANVTDQELVLSCEARLLSVHETYQGALRTITIEIQEDDAQRLDEMRKREGRVNTVLGVMVTQINDAGGGFVNQLLANQTKENLCDVTPEPKHIIHKKSENGRYRKISRILRDHDFLVNPLVWVQVGSDDEYIKWCKTQPCAVKKCHGKEDNPIIAAHVRRVEYGAGTSIKPPYATIPLLNNIHTEQHQHGESAVGGREMFELKRKYYLSKWVWDTLKKIFGYDAFEDIPPQVLCDWATDHDVYELLPNGYKEWENAN